MRRTIAGFCLVFALVGCQQAAAPDPGGAVKIEVLGFAGCPNTPPFTERVEAAAEAVGGFQVVYIDQESLAEDDLRRGYATPTALVGGNDIFGMPKPISPSMGCRMYPGGLPTADEIAARLRASKP